MYSLRNYRLVLETTLRTDDSEINREKERERERAQDRLEQRTENSERVREDVERRGEDGWDQQNGR